MSGVLGFESLRARQCIRRSRRYSARCPEPRVLALRPAVSQFLTVLSDLVNLGERGLAALQVFLARVDVGLLRERRVIVTGPLADDRDRHARMLTERQGRVTRVVKGNPRQTGPPQQAAELIGVPFGVNGSASLVGDHVLAALVPVQLGQP